QAAELALGEAGPSDPRLTGGYANPLPYDPNMSASAFFNYYPQAFQIMEMKHMLLEVVGNNRVLVNVYNPNSEISSRFKPCNYSPLISEE
ncbi:MAG TPA: hypothetical protein VKI44_25325, partial [Acetobacteraceae bacterium]|nr:hypothetical protein [Acetobacteraceae bacterium]